MSNWNCRVKVSANLSLSDCSKSDAADDRSNGTTTPAQHEMNRAGGSVSGRECPRSRKPVGPHLDDYQTTGRWWLRREVCWAGWAATRFARLSGRTGDERRPRPAT